MPEPFCWLFPVAVSLHNLEEGLLLPRYAHRFPPWQPGGADAARLPECVGVYFGWWPEPGILPSRGLHARHVPQRFAPHLTVTLATKQVMPGTLTGVLLVAPVTGTGLYLGLSSGTLESQAFVLYGADVTAAPLASLPLLLKLGERLFPDTPA